MVELVYTGDLKSSGREAVRVRVPMEAFIWGLKMEKEERYCLKCSKSFTIEWNGTMQQVLFCSENCLEKFKELLGLRNKK